jgi:hypothetical protein
MAKNALAMNAHINDDFSNHSLQKLKPRYTDEENEMLFESWWDPQQRRELVTKLGRKMSALRSQFCRLLKEKKLTNQDYYNIMQSKYTTGTGFVPRKRSRELKEIDRTILETFCRHQALGNSRTQACEELQQKLGAIFTPAALKLRFYRLVKRFHYSDNDLLNIGKNLLGENEMIELKPQFERASFEKTMSSVVGTHGERIQSIPITNSPITDNIIPDSGDYRQTSDNSIFYQISTLPGSIKHLEERLLTIEQNQRHQLDLRGFIEHLLAVERDIKKEDKLIEEIQQLMDENENIKGMLTKESDRLKKREEELSNVYKMLNTTLTDFMRLESVSKLASLGDFMHRLEITVDQFGNVLKSRRLNT